MAQDSLEWTCKKHNGFLQPATIAALATPSPASLVPTPQNSQWEQQETRTEPMNSSTVSPRPRLQSSTGQALLPPGHNRNLCATGALNNRAAGVGNSGLLRGTACICNGEKFSACQDRRARAGTARAGTQARV